MAGRGRARHWADRDPAKRATVSPSLIARTQAREDLKIHRSPNDAVELAKFDDHGQLPPAQDRAQPSPRLAPGSGGSRRAARGARSCFIPAGWRRWRPGKRIASRPRRCARRSIARPACIAPRPRYRDEQMETLVGRFCRSQGGASRDVCARFSGRATRPAHGLRCGCRSTSSSRRSTRRAAGEKVIPLLCQEACNLLVAEARKVVKGDPVVEGRSVKQDFAASALPRFNSAPL